MNKISKYFKTSTANVQTILETLEKTQLIFLVNHTQHHPKEQETHENIISQQIV